MAIIYIKLEDVWVEHESLLLSHYIHKFHTVVLLYRVSFRPMKVQKKV